MSKETQYLIHNTSRDKLGKVTRSVLPSNPKKVIFLAGGEIRIVRARPLLITESALKKHAKALLAYEAKGAGKVTSSQDVALTSPPSKRSVESVASPAKCRKLLKRSPRPPLNLLPRQL